MNQVVSLSGGKDSTAMLLEMVRRGEQIHSIIFFDTGWEFPQMYAHIDKLEAYIGQRIWRLHPTLPFDYWATARPVRNQKTKVVHRIGNGWPSPGRRWCTREKMSAVNKFLRPIPSVVQAVGYAADESSRPFSDKGFPYRFPLQEWNITEARALEICRSHGFHWDGLYDIFHRVSCYCCPLQRLDELWKLRKHFPELWDRMLKLEREMPEGTNRGFRGYQTVHDLDRQFAIADRVWSEMER